MARPCPITPEVFESNTEDIVLTGEHKGVKLEFHLRAKCEDGKSLGWTAGCLRFSMNIGGTDVPMIGSLNLTCIGSK